MDNALVIAAHFSAVQDSLERGSSRRTGHRRLLLRESNEPAYSTAYRQSKLRNLRIAPRLPLCNEPCCKILRWGTSSRCQSSRVACGLPHFSLSDWSLYIPPSKNIKKQIAHHKYVVMEPFRASLVGAYLFSITSRNGHHNILPLKQIHRRCQGRGGDKSLISILISGKRRKSCFQCSNFLIDGLCGLRITMSFI